MAPQDEIRPGRRLARFGGPLCLLLTALVWPAEVVGKQDAVRQEPLPGLEAGKTIERKLSGGGAHAFQITLAVGQRLRVIADQHGIDVAIKISTSNGRQLVEMDSQNSTQGPEIASVIAEQEDDYRIEVRSQSKSVPPGRYELRIETAGVATDQDRQWIRAQQAYTEGRRLRARPTAEALTEGIQQLEKASGEWQSLGDKLMAAHALYYLANNHHRLGELQLSL